MKVKQQSLTFPFYLGSVIMYAGNLSFVRPLDRCTEPSSVITLAYSDKRPPVMKRAKHRGRVTMEKRLTMSFTVETSRGVSPKQPQHSHLIHGGLSEETTSWHFHLAIYT
ncbi:hypothetical protein HAX54_027300 [Datura stramonium]|uniref:Uncharacterized protein n=1 Tax=Datura stramonium TaxID=4076 RepID=A0ABS8V4W0_DATST|nr:hypothetical protein [Datura stramonium]